MFTVLATLKVQKGKEEEAEELLRQLASQVEAQEPHTLTYLFHRLQNDPNTIIVFEVYKDEGAFEAHRRGPTLRQVGSQLASLLEPGGVEIQVLERFAGFQRQA